VSDDDLTLALELAAAADEVTLRRFRAHDLAVERKPDLTHVTEADRAAEALLRDRLAAARPGDAVCGEELGDTGPARRRWIIDPIDGTANYVRGVPVWATLVALEDDGEVTVGVVSAPALGHTWWAARGRGAFCDGRPIRTSAVTDLADAHVGYAELGAWDRQPAGVDGLLRLAGRCWRSRGFGDFWQHMLVAEGALDVALEPVISVWDVAAVAVVVTEAGGRFTDLAGEARLDGGDAISTNGHLHQAVLEVVGRR
jgi:histidinol-phosphatase